MSAAAEHLLARMKDAAQPMPVLRDVTGAYALQVAALADKLTPRELEILVLLGGLIYRRTASAPLPGLDRARH